jgi:membrane protease YdiL (CAAX protease family)
VSRFSHPSQSALLEVGILFLPAIPAYLWLWPVLKGLHSNVFQVLAYVYVLVGTLCIGRRRWSWLQLGLSSQGFRLTLVSGMALLAGRLAIMRGIDWSVQPPSFSWLRWLGNLLFYFGLVGLVEELLFRGLLFRLLADWRGTRWAIWGSSFAFMLWDTRPDPAAWLVGPANGLVGGRFERGDLENAGYHFQQSRHGVGWHRLAPAGAALPVVGSPAPCKNRALARLNSCSLFLSMS